ncbi:MAG: FtsX-like permease family protein [Chitinophagales bacterium]|nr:FtsX-like permease family protein [Chitinophagales bacterium]
MNFPVIFSISRTHLLSRMKQTVTASLGVTFGIGAFIILVSFMTGLNEMLDGLILNRTPHIHLYNQITPSPEQPVDLADAFKSSFNVVQSIKPKRAQTRIHNGLPILNFLRNDSRVKGAVPQVVAQVFYVSGSIELNGIINGVDILEEDRLFSISDYIVQGSTLELARTENGIIIGAGVARKMSVKPGDIIQITTPSGNIFPLKIVGVYESGLADIDDIQSYANLKTAQKLLGQSDNFITDINVKLHDLELAKPMSDKLARQFGIAAIDINSANAQFETGSDIRNLITYAVSIALLIVAGFGIYNILNMLIYEKMNDIAILKATGFSGFDVKMIFMVEALIIGIAGGILGLIIGYVVSVIIDHTPFETQALPTIKTFPVNFNPLYYIIGIVFALVTTFLAGYMPASRAQRIDPVEIIRGQ